MFFCFFSSTQSEGDNKGCLPHRTLTVASNSKTSILLGEGNKVDGVGQVTISPKEVKVK